MATTVSSHEAVEQCMRTICNIVGLHLMEMWTHSRDGFVLIQTYVDKSSMTDHIHLLSRYHSGELDNVTSRSICKRAMQSNHGFYWCAKQHKRLATGLPIHTAVALHISRDNINTDVFLVGFSKIYMKYSQAKLDFLCWMSQAATLAAFSAPLLAIKVADDSENTELEFSTNNNSNPSSEMSPFTSYTPDSVATTRDSPTTLPKGGQNVFPETPGGRGEVDVDQHVEAARQINVEEIHVRRRSLCVQDAFKMSPDPQNPSSRVPPYRLPGYDENSTNNSTNNNSINNSMHITGIAVEHNQTPSSRTEQPFSHQHQSAVSTSSSSAATKGGVPPYLALNPRNPYTNNDVSLHHTDDETDEEMAAAVRYAMSNLGLTPGLTPSPRAESGWSGDSTPNEAPFLVGGPTIGGPTIGGPTIGGPTIGGPTIGGPTIGGPTIGGPTIGGPTMGGWNDNRMTMPPLPGNNSPRMPTITAGVPYDDNTTTTSITRSYGTEAPSHYYHGAPHPPQREPSPLISSEKSVGGNSYYRMGDSPDILGDVDDSSTVVPTNHLMMGKSFNVKTHGVDLAMIEELQRSICEGGLTNLSQHSRGDYAYKISSLPIRRHINHNVDLNDFTNMAFLTEGSNSHIFSATWNNQPVIVKMLQADKAHNAVALHEFDIECELLSRIDHPNIVQVLGSGNNPRPYIVLERLRDVSEVLDLNSNDEIRPSIFHRRKFSYVEVLQLAKDLADAINYIHNEISPHAMIIHRDLKPENLGLTADRRLKLFDFGLCRCVKKRSVDVNTYKMTGNTGSLRYMAPEVVLDLPYNETVDTFSFGIVVWTIAMNKLPFRGFDRAKHHSAVVIAGGRPKLESGWPPAFSQLLSQCWHQDSAQRPSFLEISTRLGQMMETEKASTSGKGSGGSSVLRRVSVSMFGLKGSQKN